MKWLKWTLLTLLIFILWPLSKILWVGMKILNRMHWQMARIGIWARDEMVKVLAK